MTVGPTPVPALLGDFAGWVTDVIESLGYVGVAALIALENVVPPIPSEVVLPLAGFLAGQGRFWLPAVVLAATIRSIIGALILYGLAAWLGEERVRGFVDRYGRFLRIDGHDLDRANDWFDQHGGAAVAIGRLVPVVRSLVSIPAGLRRMPLPRFVLFTAAGSSVWNVVLIGTGWVLGDNWEQVDQYATYVEIAILLLLAAGGVAFLYRRRTATR